MKRRDFIAGSLAGLAASAAAVSLPASAATIDRMARIVIGFPPGGATDIPGRFIAEQLAGRYAPPVIVENKAGASGRLAVEQVKHAPADGSTMLMTPGSHFVLFPHIYRRLAYDAERDFVPVALAFYNEFVLVVGPKLPASVATARDFIRWCQANPKDAAYASPAAGTVPHFAGVMLSRASGTPMLHVPYKGGAPAMQDVMGGQIACYLATMGEALPHIRAGRLRPLATSGAQRSSLLPEVPTLKESGYDVEAQGWFGFFLPARTPAATVAGLAAAINEALAVPKLASELAKLGYEIAPGTPESFAARVRADREHWGPIAKASGFTPED
jgi:tripartite-type tricarboxylate transporter receptor subunit TctC